MAFYVAYALSEAWPGGPTSALRVVDGQVGRRRAVDQALHLNLDREGPLDVQAYRGDLVLYGANDAARGVVLEDLRVDALLGEGVDLRGPLEDELFRPRAGPDGLAVGDPHRKLVTVVHDVRGQGQGAGDLDRRTRGSAVAENHAGGRVHGLGPDGRGLEGGACQDQGRFCWGLRVRCSGAMNGPCARGGKRRSGTPRGTGPTRGWNTMEASVVNSDHRQRPVIPAGGEETPLGRASYPPDLAAGASAEAGWPSPPVAQSGPPAVGLG